MDWVGKGAPCSRRHRTSTRAKWPLYCPAAKRKACERNRAALVLQLRTPLVDDADTAHVPCAKLLSYVAILPWVRVPDLGSWILGRVASRIAQDWQGKYGHSILLLETFVEQPRFGGTVYRAANWQRVGQTTGRTRQDRHTCIQVASKDIYVYPLCRGFREALQG